MSNLGTTAPVRRPKVHRVENRRKVTTPTPTITTIHTHGTPDVTNNCCHWSWVALDKAGNEITRASGVYGDSYRVTGNVAKFHGLIQALEWLAVNAPDAPVTVLSDLELAVGIVNEEMKANERHIRLLASTAGRFRSRTKATLDLMRHKENRAAQPSAKGCLVAKGAGVRD